MTESRWLFDDPAVSPRIPADHRWTIVGDPYTDRDAVAQVLDGFRHELRALDCDVLRARANDPTGLDYLRGPQTLRTDADTVLAYMVNALFAWPYLETHQLTTLIAAMTLHADDHDLHDRLKAYVARVTMPEFDSDTDTDDTHADDDQLERLDAHRA